MTVCVETDDGLVRAVDGLSFGVERGRTLGIVGESGSGKTAAALALMGLHHSARTRVSGEIWLEGKEITSAGPDHMRRLRGGTIAMIFQDPLTSLHPYYTVGAQVIEAYKAHHPGVSRPEAHRRAVEMLGRVGIPQPDRRAEEYPHQFSGGMRQRVVISMALVNSPRLLIADEPTTALDATVQAEILDLIRDVQEESGTAVILITHDLDVVAEAADDVLVMYAGRCVEKGPVRDVFNAAAHPYTWGLLTSMPRMDVRRQDRLVPIPGNPPSLLSLPTGCAFHPRCPYAQRNGELSFSQVPGLTGAGGPSHQVACHLPSGERQRIFREEIAPLLQWPAPDTGRSSPP
ncbi:ABC transporter ATP-binding protein [Streptomyces sp. NBC_00829]|nr:ABC transporter ATP-binding protein [Streptomyces sp. NBC_00829]